MSDNEWDDYDPDDPVITKEDRVERQKYMQYLAKKKKEAEDLRSSYFSDDHNGDQEEDYYEDRAEGRD